jgi:hypothetical protein
MPRWIPFVAGLVAAVLVVGLVIRSAQERSVPDNRAAASLVDQKFDLSHSVCGRVVDGDPGYWDYECTMDNTTGTMLVRLDGSKISDTSIIA